MLFSATFPRNIEELARYALRPGYKMIDTIGEDAEQTADKVSGWEPPVSHHGPQCLAYTHRHEDSSKCRQ